MQSISVNVFLPLLALFEHIISSAPYCLLNFVPLDEHQILILEYSGHMVVFLRINFSMIKKNLKSIKTSLFQEIFFIQF